MPIGEDIPMLIPVSIVIAVFLTFLFSLFINSTDRFEIIKMSQTSLTICEYTIKKFSNNYTALELSELGEENCPKCSELKELNISSNYKIKIVINSTEGCWCWGKELDGEKVVVNSMPILIFKDWKTFPGMVSVYVWK